MAQYSGVSPNLDQARGQHAGKKGFRKWQVANGGKPFTTRELALAWLKTQPGEKDPRAAPAPGQWYGYTFEYTV